MYEKVDLQPHREQVGTTGLHSVFGVRFQVLLPLRICPEPTLESHKCPASTCPLSILKLIGFVLEINSSLPSIGLESLQHPPGVDDPNALNEAIAL